MGVKLRKLLVIGSSAIIRKAFIGMFNQFFEVDYASSWIVAEQKLEASYYDMILSEVNFVGAIHELRRLTSKHQLSMVVLADGTESPKLVAQIMAVQDVNLLILPEYKYAATSEQEQRILHLLKLALTQQKRPVKKVIKRAFSPTRKKIVVIGSSTGGPRALEILLSQLPKSIPTAILVAQHMPKGFTQPLAERLNKCSELLVKEAEDGDELQEGRVLLAPGGMHMELVADVKGQEGIIRLNEGPRELGVKPSVNILFSSVAKIFKETTIGLILTGMGVDGTRGAEEIKSNGGTIIAESEETCLIYGMPKNVIESGLADEVVPLDKIGVALLQLLEI